VSSPMQPVRLAGAAAAALTFLALAGAAPAAEPPNPNDPCVSGTHNACGTTGVGFYKTYRYGTRWFGDYRNVVAGEFHMYCIDLRFWYPGRQYAYRPMPAAGLHNRDGEAVGDVNLEKAAYAIWTYGRTTNDNQAAAVMLYVHSLMGDARPGELDPAALNPTVVSLYGRIAGDSALYHGPYRVVVDQPGAIAVGKTGTAIVRVLSGAGVLIPNLDLTLSATGATVPAIARTNANGVATVPVKATTAAGARVKATTEPLPATMPTIYAPTTLAAARNGQRLAVSGSQRVSGEGSSTGSKAQVSLTTAAAPADLDVGGQSVDNVTIGGALPSYNARIAVRVYGPFRSAAEIGCAGTPFSEGSFAANGSGSYKTPSVTLTKPGLYQYQEVAPADENHLGFTTPCTAPAERVRVSARPTLHTAASSQPATTGATVSDSITVSGLAGEHVTVQADLYGPFPARDAIACTGTPAWSGKIDVPADGTYQTQPQPVTVPGYYAYYESIAASEFVRAVKTTCADTAETVILSGQPKLVTQVSAQKAKPGGTITDRVKVGGSGVLQLSVQVALYGPFATRGAISCSGTPYWHGLLVTKGDGAYTTAPAKIDKAGYYTYYETMAASPASSAASTTCAETAETTFVSAQPAVTTIASSEVVVPGGSIYDRVLVRGLGQTPARIRVELFGPFATRAAIGCTTRLHSSTVVTARGDGELRTPPFRLARAGFYTFREQVIGSPLVAEFTTPCAQVAETSLARPEIITGRGDHASFVRARAGTPDQPVRVRIQSLGIDAPVAPVGIDVPHGVLGVPPPIHRTGWWADGAAPGARSGAVLIAGHVDRAGLGPGAFFRLKDARPGDHVTVTTRSGRTVTYRVVSVHDYLKRRLPADVYSLRGRARLVLVTCGGPFIASLGHYRDNVVLTAVPA
jgi:sortase family protein